MFSRAIISAASAATRPSASATLGRSSNVVSAGSRRYASHGPTLNQPSGYVFGEKPVAGQKRKWESWELTWYVGMFGSLALATVVLVYKPDTSIQTWALEEAKRRMEARGDLPKYKPSDSA